MDIRDVVHGAISIEKHELPLVDSIFFQRLRQIKQMGFAEYSYPNATHNRYTHSLGALETASRVFHAIFSYDVKSQSSKQLEYEPALGLMRFQPEAFDRFRAVVRIAALLHDIGHGPLSHTTEFAMPPVESLQLPSFVKANHRKATHEDYTLKIILDSSLTPLIEKAGQKWGFKPIHIASLIQPELLHDQSFFTDTLRGEKINFQPILHQIISSELDADRMDYLRRDSFSAGVTYGMFDFPWLLSNLTSHLEKGHCYLALRHRAIYSFEDFLISRFHMFLMVYFHHKTVIYDELLGKYLSDPQCEYKLPSDIEAYCQATDAQLSTHLSLSKNPWAMRIAERNPFRMLIETHSGIPAHRKAQDQQEQLIAETQTRLKNQGIDFIMTQSLSELSKYFGVPSVPIFIFYNNFYSSPEFIPLQKCTDLFMRYKEKRSITRIYVAPEDHSKLIQSRARQSP